MKTPIKIQCPQCGLEQDVFIRLDDTYMHLLCQCGEDVRARLSGFFTIGEKLLSRSLYEFKHNSDYSLCIVFSATAMECELSRLYFKWKKHGAKFRNVSPTDDEIEESLRKFRNIAVKIEEVTKLIYPAGINAFVATNRDLIDIFRKEFKQFSLKNVALSFQKELFWPRNQILHLGHAKFNSEKAERCFNVASLGLEILHRLENHK